MAETMGVRIDTTESNEVLRVLTEALVRAGRINETSDLAAKPVISKFLKDVEDDVTGFFRNNVDRRKEPREKPIFEDMEFYYKISARFY